VASFAAIERDHCEPHLHTTGAQFSVELKSIRLAYIVTLCGRSRDCKTTDKVCHVLNFVTRTRCVQWTSRKIGCRSQFLSLVAIT